MHGCQSSKLPKRWLMTDPRYGERLLASIQKLPKGSGVIFRHYDAPNRLDMFHDIAKICRRRGLTLIFAGEHIDRKMNKAVGCYFGRPQKTKKRYNSIILFGVHNVREIRNANTWGADAYLLSPVFSTNSHKGHRPLGLLRFRQLRRLCDKPVIALGGMSQARFQPMKYVHGYAAIDGLIR